VEIDGEEEERGARRVHRLDNAAAIDVTLDQLDGVESQPGFGREVHRQHDAGDHLDHQHHREDAAKRPPVIEVLGCGVIHQVLLGEPDDREAVVEPFFQSARRRVAACMFGHALAP